jgi:hypothetical protein
MRYLDFYATLDESLAILELFCAQGFQIIAEPELFDTPNAPVFARVDERLREIVKVGPGVYLSGSFTRFPISYLRIPDGEHAGKYFINSGTAGPIIDCLLARVNLVDGVQRVLAGQISHQRAYRNPQTQDIEPASDALKNAFKQAVSIIKKQSVTYQSEIGKILIGPAALALLKSGQAQLGPAP